MAYAIRRLEQEVQGLVNQQQIPLRQNYTEADDIDYLKKQFEKLNSMLGLIQTSAQTIIEKGVKYESWKQSSNVYRNVLQPLADLMYIDGKFQNGLTRTQFAMKPNGTKYAIQGGNTLCGDVFELVVIYRNGLARNVIPNEGLPTMWNNLCNILSIVTNLGESISTQQYTQELTINGSTVYIANGTIGGFKHYESVLENYCMAMWKLCQSILGKITDIRIGGIGSIFGANQLVAINQCSLGPGVSLAPFNTCAEIFNTMQSPLTVVSTCADYPFNGNFAQMQYLTSIFTPSTTNGALLSLFTVWNPFSPDAHTLIGNGVEQDSASFGLIQSAAAITTATYGRAFGSLVPSVNRFDVNREILTYQTNTSTGNYENYGLNIQLYFVSNQVSGADQPNNFDLSETEDIYGSVTGKVIINSTGFNFIGHYSNSVNTTNKTPIPTNATLDGTEVVLYQLGGRLYYA